MKGNQGKRTASEWLAKAETLLQEALQSWQRLLETAAPDVVALAKHIVASAWERKIKYADRMPYTLQNRGILSLGRPDELPEQLRAVIPAEVWEEAMACQSPTFVSLDARAVGRGHAMPQWLATLASLSGMCNYTSAVTALLLQRLGSSASHHFLRSRTLGTCRVMSASMAVGIVTVRARQVRNPVMVAATGASTLIGEAVAALSDFRGCGEAVRAYGHAWLQLRVRLPNSTRDVDVYMDATAKMFGTVADVILWHDQDGGVDPWEAHGLAYSVQSHVGAGDALMKHLAVQVWSMEAGSWDPREMPAELAAMFS